MILLINKVCNKFKHLHEWCPVIIEVMWEAIKNIVVVLIPPLVAVAFGTLLILFLSSLPEAISDIILTICLTILIFAASFYIIKAFIDRCKVVKKQHEIRKELENKK